ncbi:discoidin domain-containing protein [Maribacter sp. 2304DJ31-5]|uniref:discoidin domain-containing protein n=1 Tax=Maribacter sp. 2304DJ31-5 TaxID=3386273 RepID=UPI0039BCE820
MSKHTCFYLFLILFIACNEKSRQFTNKLERTLELSGNRPELEKVLAHYSENPKDSLKHSAAVFLIENMEHHYYYAMEPRNERRDTLKLSDNHTKQKYDNYPKAIADALKSAEYNRTVKHTFQKDIENINAEQLIENIDIAFEVWPKPWNDFLDFDGFCNYILPYRQKNEALELTLRAKQYQKSKQKLNDSTSIDSMIEVVKDVSIAPSHFQYNQFVPIDLPISDFEKGKTGDCINLSIYAAFKAKALGIPMVIDFTIWPNGRSSHYWNSVVYSKDSILCTDGFVFSGKHGSYRPRKKIAKIYRLLYAQQEASENHNERIKTNTFLDNPHIVDVTSQYIETNRIRTKVRTIEGKAFSTAYLCVFNNNKWQPIAKTNVEKGGYTTFNEVGRGNIHIIFYFDKGEWVAASNPFSIDMAGNKYTHIANGSKKIEVRLNRKTKITNRIKWFGRRMFGGVFQLSNDPDFRNAVTVNKISEGDTVLMPRTVNIQSRKTYRYARYKGKKGWPAEIAEMQWFSKERKLSGKIIGPHNSDDGKNAFDDDLLSYFSPRKIEDSISWIGMDFGKRQKISKLYFAPRSDVNYVKPGDNYELLYWNDKWVSLGIKKAETHNVQYDNVPEKALMWLRNLSEGIEEELFVYKNGRQHFWSSAK